jgi:hypothetical protein
MQCENVTSFGSHNRRGPPKTVTVPLQERAMWSVREWAAMRGISVATAYRWIANGDVTLSKWRGRSFITRDASDAWSARLASGTPTKLAA